MALVQISNGKPSGGKRLERVGRIVLVCLLLSVSVCSTAHAKCGPICPGDQVNDPALTAAEVKDTLQKVKDSAAKVAELSGIGKVWNALSPLFKEGFGKFMDKMDLQTAVRVASTNAQMRVNLKLHDDEINAAHAQKDIEAQANRAGNHPVQEMKKNLLCSTITARQMILVMEQFAQLVSQYVMAGFVRDRAGDGVYAAARYRGMRYGLLNKNDPATGNGIDGVPELFRGKTNVQLAPGLLFSFPDASLSAGTLDATAQASNRIVMTLPKINPEKMKLSETEEIAVSVPIAENGNYQQQLWIAARDYCYNLMGATPLPPMGEAADVPAGISRSSRDATCYTAQRAFLQVCADRLASLTRPNCKEDVFKPFCEASKIVCQAGIGNGMALPESYENCEKGLSLVETKLIAINMCATEARHTGALASNSTQVYQLLDGTFACDRLQAKWVEEQKKDKKRFNEAVRGMQRIPSCWSGHSG